MIDFNAGNFFARLKKVQNNEFGTEIMDILVEGEIVNSVYKSVRDGVVFTSKRIIAINVQGITGKKKDFTSIPYSKIQTFSVETAGTFDLDSELEIWISGIGRVKFEFTSGSNVKDICKFISNCVL